MRAFSDFFFFNDTATTEIYTLSLHDALPIYLGRLWHQRAALHRGEPAGGAQIGVWGFCIAICGAHEKTERDRKSTRLNSSHLVISYAVFCLKKKTHLTRRTASATRHYSSMRH